VDAVPWVSLLDGVTRTVELFFGFAHTKDTHVYRSEVTVTTTLSVGCVAVGPVNLTVSTTVRAFWDAFVVVVQYIVVNVEA
jgi:hypothetical protein